MSWDIYVQDIPPSVKSVSEMPDDFEPRALGRRADIIARIREIVPSADFTSPSCGQIDGPDFSIEVSIGNLEQVESFAFHVRGGDLAAIVVADILRHLGLRALDPSSPSGIFELDGDPAAGLRRWRDYRDSIAGKTV
jgi:hypothetical protein